MVALTLYYTSQASSVTNAAAAGTASGGTQGNGTLSLSRPTAGTYLEMRKATGLALSSTLPAAASTYGQLLDSTLLEGKTLTAGTWTGTFNFKYTGVAVTGRPWIQVFKRSGAGVYTSLGSGNSGADVALTTSYVAKTITFSIATDTLFITGDKLYFELYFVNSARPSTGTDSIEWYLATTTLGVTTAQLVTPGYTTTPVTSSRPIASISAAVKQTNIEHPLSSVSAATQAFGLTRSMTDVSASITIGGTYFFGTIGTDPTHASIETAAGLGLAEVDVGWNSYETADGVFSSSYASTINTQVAALRAAGLPVVLGLALHYPPAWAYSLANSQYVNQFGSTGGQINLVFNKTLRQRVEALISRIDADIGLSNFYAIRITSGGDAEILYPDEWADGVNGNGYWAYDANAQGTGGNLPTTLSACPSPGWHPGDTTWNSASFTVAQTQAWYDWYMGALADVVNWQIQTYKALGYHGKFYILTPGHAASPEQYTWGINHLLDGTEWSYTLGRGGAWHAFYTALIDTVNVTAYCSSIADHSGNPVENLTAPGDDSVLITDTQTNNWSAARWITYLAHRRGMAVSGENPGGGGTYGSSMMLNAAFAHIVASKIQDFYWTRESNLFGGGGNVSIDDYASAIKTVQAGHVPRVLVGISAAVVVGGAPPTTTSRPLTGISAALQALSISRTISGVSASVAEAGRVLIASDTYTRANTVSGWGTSTNTDGVANYAWGIDGTGLGVKITSNRGTSNNASTDYTAILDDGTSRTLAEVLYKFSVSAVSANVRGVIRHNGGGTSGTDSYRAGYSNTTIEIRSRRASISTVRATTPFTPTLAQDYWVRFQVITSGGGNPLCNVRWWQDGASEPSTWGLSWEDTTGNPVPAGLLGFQLNASTTATSISIGQYRAYALSVPPAGATYTRPLSGISAAVQALGVARPVVGVSAAMQALELTRPLVGVSGAIQALGLTRSIVSVSASLVFTGTRSVVGLSAALLASQIARPVSSISASLLFTGTHPVSGITVATKAVGVERTLINVSGSVGAGGIPRTITGVSVALQALHVPRSLINVSAATLQPGITRSIIGVTASASVAYSRSIAGVSAATLQPGIVRTLVGISASLSVTYTRPVTGISSALQAFGVARPIAGVSVAVGVSGISRTIIGVSAATKQLGVARPLVSISAATIQVGITRPLVGLSASVVLTASRSISGLSTAVQALGVEHLVVSITTATKALGVSRPITGVVAAVGQGGISRTISGISAALQAFGVPRNVSGVSSALQAVGVTRSLVGISGVVKQIGLTRDISGVSVALAQTVSRTVIGVTSAVQALSLLRPIVNVSSSVTLRTGKTVTGVSSAVKALGVARPITGILGAIGVAGITRPLTNISASLYFSGKMYTSITVIGTRGNVTVEGTRGTITALGTRGTITVQEE